MMEKLSQKVLAPPVAGKPYQTRWFYERSRGKWEQEQMKLTQAQRKPSARKVRKSGCQEGKAGEMFEYYSYESSPGLSKLCHQLQSFCGLC